MNKTSERTTFHAQHFGFEEVRPEEKQGRVGEVFSHVANRYDVMNDVMSGGLHHVWKDRLIDALRPASDMHLLDVAGGTGDIAFRFLQAGGGQVTISDINEDMLTVGRARAYDKHLPMERITWQQANAEELPFEDASFDAYTISFGIRNVTHLDKVLAEAYRALKTGGRFLCLEFSEPDAKWLKRVYDAYSFRVIPQMGAAITGDADAYRYLVESIRQFPPAEEFKGLIEAAGFANVRFTRLTGGVVAIHSGWKV